jgi:hypothetical protein
MAGVGNAAVRVARSRPAIGRQLATTPGRLRLAAALLALGAIAFGALAARAADTRRQAVRSVATTEPLLVDAVDLSAGLSDVHAIAAFSFLVGGTEPALSRRRYERELRRTGAGVAALAGEVGTSPGSGPAVRSITQRLPVYAGLIDNARANNRQGFPVGSAYLRRASTTMRDEILPSARELYKTEAKHLTTHYRAGVSSWTVPAVILAGGALLALLAATQLYIARATRRVVNPRLALATAVLLGLLAWIFVGFALQESRLLRAQRTGSDPVELLTAARILALRAQADESTALAARGGGAGESRLADVDRGFVALTRPIGRDRAGHARGSGGLLDVAAARGHRTAAIDAIYGAYRRYLAAHARVVRQEIRGDFSTAVKLAVGASPRSTRRAGAALNDALAREVRVAQARFDDAVSRADAALGGLAAGIPVLTALSALLALLGVRQRLREYR